MNKYLIFFNNETRLCTYFAFLIFYFRFTKLFYSVLSCTISVYESIKTKFKKRNKECINELINESNILLKTLSLASLQYKML